MRKVILNLAISLDGYIEGPNGEYDWCFADQDYGMTEFFGDIDIIFLGRKSYELLIAADDNPFPGVKKFVFSETLTQVQHEDVEIVSRIDFESTVKELMNKDGGAIWLFGGADLVSSFINADLITDFILSVHPVLLGGGKLLFQQLQHRIDLIHMGTETFSSGLVQLKYIPKPKFDYSLLEDHYRHSNIDQI